MKISTSIFTLLTIYALSAESLECNTAGLCYGSHWSYGGQASHDDCLALCKSDNSGCQWVSYSQSTKHCYGFTDCNRIQNYYDYVTSQVECEMNSISKEPQPKDRCFHLSANDCNCDDVVYKCLELCQPLPSRYIPAYETCCCLE